MMAASGTKFQVFLRCIWARTVSNQCYAENTVKNVSSSVRGHMIELCMKCTKMEHKHCKTVMDIKEAAEKIYSKFHGEKIGTSIEDLNEGFKDLKAVAEELKNKFLEKRQNVLYKIKQVRKEIDDYLDQLEARAVAETDQTLKEYRRALEEKIRVCEASIASLRTIISEIDRTLSLGNEEKKFIAINRATIQTRKYCKVLYELQREISEMKVNLEPDVTLPYILQSLGTISVDKSKVSDLFSDITPIYTGEMMVKHDGISSKVRVIYSYHVLQDGRKIVLDYNDNKIQLYDKNNIFLTETVIFVQKGERCIGVVLNTNIVALVSTSNGRVLKVMIDDDFAVSKIKTKYKIFSVTNLRYDILCARVANDQWKICIMDKNLDKTLKTILIADRGTLLSVPMFLASSADKDTVYVLEVAKGCYGITIDSRIMFHYEDPNAECYRGLVIDSDGLIIGSRFK